METKASYFLVGAFVLASALAIVTFVVWLSAFGAHVRYEPYYVRFSGSVSQLRVDSTVLFGGIPVGKVIDVGIDRQNSELARVSIELREGTPVRVDSVATLEVQSLAGGVVMQISRGSRELDLLPPGSEIKAGSSTLEQLARQLPDLLMRVDELGHRLESFLTPENAANISGALQNLQSVTAKLAGMAQDLDASAVRKTIKDADAAILSIKGAAEQMRTLAGNLDVAAQSLGAQTKDAAGEVSAMARSIANASDRLATMIEENREPMKQFSGSALYEASALVTELRRLVQSMSRISHQIEKDPARFFLGDRGEGVEAK